MITVIKKMFTVIKSGFSDILSLNHRNQKINLLKPNHRNHFIQKTMGQSIAEYSILISVIAAALFTMQIYMKRGIQAAIKYNADQFGNQSDWMEDPDKAMEQQITMESSSNTARRIQQEGIGDTTRVTTTITDNSVNTGVTTSWKDEEWQGR
jgi:hypothetical protein